MLVSITIIRIRIIDQRALAIWSSNGNSNNNSNGNGNANNIATSTATTPATRATAMSQPQYAHARMLPVSGQVSKLGPNLVLVPSASITAPRIYRRAA